MTNHNKELCEASFREIEKGLGLLPRPQDYLDLDAAGFLMVALGHLVKAREKLDQEPRTYATYHAKRRAQYAANHVRFALKLLDEQKEETCEHSSKS